ncbi:protein MKS1 [Gastrolobium bilobum]|uniref:protein MKS1 n=1 Tax=Gastrolobium bilobum TaxID=150636 RepID=UPI002AB0A0AE|nr:protein MKS1 [Gastrolobium bilobum]
MNPPEFPSGGTSSPSSKKELQIQGTRPPPLRVSKESRKICKPPLPPAAHLRQPPPPPPEDNQRQQPVIIYSVSPKVLHVTVNDFMNVVQRLTGPSSGDEPPQRSGDVSPAARLASIEKTSPSEKERVHSGDDDLMAWLLEGVEVGQFPGILSPAPATLPPIPSGYFSPVTDPQTMSFLQELSPFWSAASPSGLLSAAVVSPLPSPDLFNLFD